MLQHSKILRSREDWKAKATARGNEVREQRKTLRRYQQRIADLKAQNKQLTIQLKDAGEKTPAPPQPGTPRLS